MMRAATIVVAASLFATSSTSHVPNECVDLFHDAGRATDGVVRKGNEANEVAMNGLDKGRWVDINDYMTLADRLAQLLGWQGSMFVKMTAAIECVDKRH